MKLGFVSAILDELCFEEVVDFASDNGFRCIEMMCWPKGNVERRYAGITHIDADEVNDKKAEYINNYLSEKDITISGLGYYPNPLDPDMNKRDFYIQHIKKCIKAAQRLGVKIFNTFIGRDQLLGVEDNFINFITVWKPIIEYAEDCGVKIAIENCPMLFTDDEWPGGKNLAVSPAIWNRMFEEIDSDYFGLNYDPSHLLFQQMNYIKPIYEFANKIFHVHIKDTKIYRDKLDRVGILAKPLEYMVPKLPGLGDINWGQFISALTDIGYQNCICIEAEDKAFEDSIDSKKNSLLLSKKHVDQFVI